MAAITTDPQPGDWFLVNTGNEIAKWIRLGEFIADGFRRTEWNHAGIASRQADGVLLVVEAEPGGATEREFRYEKRPHIWVKGVPAAGAAAIKYRGVPYSFLDYAALTAHAIGVNDPGLMRYIEDTGHMICSQLVDQAQSDAGNHLFSDGRWPGYVKPSDLGRLVKSSL